MISLEARCATLAPKAEALDRIAIAKGSLTITDAAMALQHPPGALFRILHQRG